MSIVLPGTPILMTRVCADANEADANEDVTRTAPSTATAARSDSNFQLNDIFITNPPDGE
jgi:hypothetical protein